jgi:ABC-type sugar transport system permease subunit
MIIIGIIVGLILIGILVTMMLKRRREESPKGTNYRAILILGTVFSPVGIIYLITFFISDETVFLVLGLSFIGMGLSYLAIGLNNKDKWKIK